MLPIRISGEYTKYSFFNPKTRIAGIFVFTKNIRDSSVRDKNVH